VRIVTFHATQDDAFASPGVDAFTMGAIDPVSVFRVMALGADKVPLIHADKVPGGEYEFVSLSWLQGMTGATPDMSVAMQDFCVVRGFFKNTYVRISLHEFMAGRAWLKFKLVGSRGNSESWC
jgi:hypothetical protein